jgi:hypothetical protein
MSQKLKTMASSSKADRFTAAEAFKRFMRQAILKFAKVKDYC